MSLLLIYTLSELKYAVYLKSHYRIYYTLSPYIISPHTTSPLCLFIFFVITFWNFLRFC